MRSVAIHATIGAIHAYKVCNSRNRRFQFTFVVERYPLMAWVKTPHPPQAVPLPLAGEGKGRIQQMLYKDEWGRYGESGVMFCLWQSDMLLTACDMLWGELNAGSVRELTDKPS